MEDAYETIEVDENRTIKIYPDADPMSPRDADCFGKIYHWHPHYSFDKEEVRLSRDADSINETLDRLREEDALILPLYLLDHSGIWIRTTDFGDPWDSGQVGFYVATKQQIYDEFEIYGLTHEESVEKAKELMRCEVDALNAYVSGGMTRFVTETRKEPCSACGHIEVEYDSCGSYDSVESAIEAAKYSLGITDQVDVTTT